MTTMHRKLNVAVIGAGHLGRIHTRLLKANPNFVLTGVADTCAASRERCESEFGVTATDDYDTLLDGLDAAVIATPTASHYPIAIKLLSRGIHTLIEKPVTNTTPQADHLIQLADRQETVFQVGHVERFNPVFQQASLAMPEPRYIEATRMSGYTFRSTDVGVVMDLMIHDIDLIGALVESPLVEVRAVGVSVFGPHEDIAQARLEFENGTVANLTASRCSFENARQISWFNERGYIAANMATGELQQVQLSETVNPSEFRDCGLLGENQQDLIRNSLFDTVLPKSAQKIDPQNAIENEHNDFARAICGNRMATVTGRDGRRAVSIAQKIVESINQHRWQSKNECRVGAQAQTMNLFPHSARRAG